MKRVFIYTRVSTNEQVSGGGFDRQREVCLKFCESRGWLSLRGFQEQESGSVETAGRPVLSEAISLCGTAYDVCTIVVERADRIARDLIVAELFFRECKSRGIEVYAADSGEELVNAESDPTRKLIRQVLGALAEWDKAQIVRKLQDGRRRKKGETGWPCGGPIVFGRKPGEGKWVWRILAMHRLGVPILEISRALNYAPLYRAEKIKFWARSTIAGVIQTWENRAEFSAGKLKELLDDPAASTIFSVTLIRSLKAYYAKP